jgi:pilus assembly protein FimV
MRRFLAKALATLLVAFSASALAMGLGDIRLNSYLNQRLDAEIELVSAAADEIESLQIGLADSAAFERVGLDRSAALSTLRFNVVRRPNGTAYIHVTSTEPVREPFLSFLVEADWSRGRLLREYTLLIDPPTFADEQDAAPAEAQSPVVAESGPAAETLPEPEVPAEVPATADTASQDTGSDVEAAVVEEAPEEYAVEEPVREPPAREPAEEAVAIPPLEAERATSRAPAAPRAGGSYGAIQRNETLWGIASRLKPDDSVTMNQMMVAIYRANPEAFAGNMNQLKQGYILRIPEYAEVTTISRTEAFSEARRMNDEWNAARNRYVETEDYRTVPEEDVVEPEADDSLSLVAPDEDVEPEVGTGVGAGGEADDIGAPDEGAVAVDESDVDEGAVDLVEEDDAGADRLIDVEDESMLAVQQGAADSEVDTDEGVTGEESADESAIAEETTIDESVPAEEETLAESDDTDATVVGETTVADETTDTQEPVEEPAQEAVTETQPDRRTVAPARQPEPSLVDQATRFALSPIGLGIIGGVLLLILVMLVLMQKRRKAAKAQAAAEMADWMADEMDESEETILAASSDEDSAEDDDFGSAFGRDEELEGSGTEALGADTESTQMLRPEDMPEPEAGDDAGSPAPLSEPSHEDTMIGGETVTMDDNDPMSEADFNMAYGLYDQAAEIVAKAIENEPSRTDFKAKLCEVHYAANNTDEFLAAAAQLKEAAGADSSEWSNVAIMGQQLAPKDPLFAGGGGGGAAVDLDFGESEAEETSSDSSGATAESDAGDDLDFDLDIGGTDSSPEEPEKAAAPEGDSAAQDSDLDFDLDLDTGSGSQSVGESVGESAGESAGEGAGEGAGESPATADTSSDESSDFDLGDFDLGESDDTGSDAEPKAEEPATEYSSDDTQTEFDKALSELSAYVDTNLPESDAGDVVSPGDSGDDAGGDLNLDEFSFDSDSDDATAGGDSGMDSDISGSDFDSDSYDSDDEDDLGEIGTKLDLARAYIDMGDPDGAKGILQEVLEDGDDAQKSEAQSLLDKL